MCMYIYIYTYTRRKRERERERERESEREEEGQRESEVDRRIGTLVWTFSYNHSWVTLWIQIGREPRLFTSVFEVQDMVAISETWDSSRGTYRGPHSIVLMLQLCTVAKINICELPMIHQIACGSSRETREIQ